MKRPSPSRGLEERLKPWDRLIIRLSTLYAIITKTQNQRAESSHVKNAARKDILVTIVKSDAITVISTDILKPIVLIAELANQLILSLQTLNPTVVAAVAAGTMCSLSGH